MKLSHYLQKLSNINLQPVCTYHNCFWCLDDTQNRESCDIIHLWFLYLIKTFLIILKQMHYNLPVLTIAIDALMTPKTKKHVTSYTCDSYILFNTLWIILKQMHISFAYLRDSCQRMHVIVHNLFHPSSEVKIKSIY